MKLAWKGFFEGEEVVGELEVQDLNSGTERSQNGVNCVLSGPGLQ